MSNPTMLSTLDQAVALADRFVEWQNAYGRPSPDSCPWVTPGPCISTQFHSPTYLAIALYRTFDATGEARYREAADRYVAMYMAAMCDPLEGDQELSRPSYPFMYGMALAAYGEFKTRNPDETWLDAKASAIFDWLKRFKWNEGSWYRNGYGFAERGTVDCGFSEDNLNMGRGLMALYDVTRRDDVLAEARGLAGYYLSDLQKGTYQGCWSEQHGTWVVGPVGVGSFEHFEGQEAFDIGWGFTSVGVIEFLTRLARAVDDADLRADIARRCVASMRWQLDDCQFDDGACGLAGLDDKWLGMTAGAVLSFLRVRDAGFLTPDEVAEYGARARRAGAWMLDHLDDETVAAGGYVPVTGGSEPRPPENLAWMLSWVLVGVLEVERV